MTPPCLPDYGKPWERLYSRLDDPCPDYLILFISSPLSAWAGGKAPFHGAGPWLGAVFCSKLRIVSGQLLAASVSNLEPDQK